MREGRTGILHSSKAPVLQVRPSRTARRGRMGQPSNSVTIRRNSLRESVPGRVGERSRGSGPPVLSLPKGSKAGRLLLVPVLSEARGPAKARESLGRFEIGRAHV